MRNYDFLPGLFLGIVSTGTCVMAYKLGLGSASNPGPGYFSFGIAFLLGFMSFLLCFKEVLRKARNKEKNISSQKVIQGRPMAVLGALLLFAICLEFLGLCICTFLLMMFLVGVVGRQKWRLTILVGFFAVAFAYVIFIVLLGVPFPRGILGI